MENFRKIVGSSLGRTPMFCHRGFLFLLIFLVGFLILPKTCLADGFEEITFEEADKYFSLSKKDVQKLLNGSLKAFNKENIELQASGYSTDEEITVTGIFRKLLRVNILNYLLMDVPIEVAGKVIKTAV